MLLENPASINDNGDVSLNMDIVARHSQDLYPLSDNLAFSKDSEVCTLSHAGYWILQPHNCLLINIQYMYSCQNVHLVG